MKKITLFLLVALLLCSMLVPVSAADAVTFFVATDGNDQNAGTIDAPFATLAKARDAVRAAGKPAVVNIRGGVYHLTETLELTSKDKNTVYRAYMDEEVLFTGSYSFKGSSFKAVTDKNVTDRIVNTAARKSVLQVDLKAMGITDYGKIYMRGFGYSGNPNPPALLFNSEAMTLARYPNNDYARIDVLLEKGADVRNAEVMDIFQYAGQGMKFQVNDSRLKQWGEADEIWIYGYFNYDWADGCLAAKVDPETQIVTTEYPSFYCSRQGQRFYFYNLLEELDKAGEWYLDRETGILYIMPPKGFNKDSVFEFITFADDIVNLKDSKNITFQGLTMANTVGQGIVMEGASDIEVSDCEFYNISSHIVRGTDITRINVLSNHFHDIGAGAVYFKGGDRAKLIPSDSLIENNLIERFQQITATGYSGIMTEGVGYTIRHNKLDDSAGCAISTNGNDMLIEYNEVSNFAQDITDAGGIYAGRAWTEHGNIMRYNYIHDAELIDNVTNMNTQAIYLDDMVSGWSVYGNVIENVSSIALYGGGRYNTFENNLIINCPKAFEYDERGITWMDCGEGSDIMNYLLALPYKEGVWKERFPELSNLLEDQPALPKYASIKNNVSYKSAGFQLANSVKQHALALEPNMTINKTGIFADYKNGDFTIVDDTEIKAQLPEFQAIPFKEMGMRTDDVEAVEKDAVTLFIGSPRAVAKGQKTFVDPQNMAVQPIVKDDRTLVPVRFIAESFGAQVGWDEATSTVTVQNGDTTITLVIDTKDMKVNDQVITLDVPAQTINDRTLIPLRAVAEALGKQVFWDDKGLIVMSDKENLVDKDDTFVIDSLIRNISVQ